MLAMKDRKPLTPEQIADAKRLKAIYQQKKIEYRDRGQPLTQEIVAGEFGWSGQTAVSQYINGNIPLNLESVAKFAKFFGVPISEISPNLASMLPDATLAESNVTSHPGRVSEVPLISWVQAGAWEEVIDLYEAGDAEDWILCGVPHSGKAFALRVNGESMRNPGGRPSFEDGDIIFVDPERQVENKSLVIARVNGDTEATFKQIIFEDGRQFLQALNPNWPQKIIEMPHDTKIVGVVRGKMEVY